MDAAQEEAPRRPRRAASRGPLLSLIGGGGGAQETGQFGRSGPDSSAISASCNFCKQRHIRCDGKTPCGQCTKRHLVCQYGVRAKTGPKPRVNPDAVYTQLSQEIQNHRHRADYWKNKFLSLKAQLETEAISLQSPSSSTSNSTSSMDTPSKKNAKSAARRAIKESRLAIWSSALATMTYLTSLVQPGGNLHSCYFEDTHVPKAKEWVVKDGGDPNEPPKMVKVESDEAPAASRLGLAMDLFEASIAPMVTDYKFKRSMESAVMVWTMSFAEACKLEGGRLLSVLEHAVVLTMSFYSMQDVRCGEKYEKQMEMLLGVTIWAREMHMLSQYADKLAQVLIHILAFWSGDSREGRRQTLVTLAYQIVSLHRPFVSASSMHRIFMTMMTYSDNHRDRQQWMEEALRCEGPDFSEVHSFKYAFHIFYVFCSIHPRMSYETQRPNYSIKELFGFLQILEFAATKLRDQDADFSPFATAFPDLALSFHLFIHGTRAECLFLLGDHRAALRLAQWVIESADYLENPSFIYLFAIQSSLEICFVMKQLDWVYRAVAMLNDQVQRLPLAEKLNKRNQEILHIHVPPSSEENDSSTSNDSSKNNTTKTEFMAVDITPAPVSSTAGTGSINQPSHSAVSSSSSSLVSATSIGSSTSSASSSSASANGSGSSTVISANGTISSKKKVIKNWLDIANSTPPMEHVPEGLDVDSIIRRETTVVDDHPKNPLTVSNILGRSVLDGTTSEALTRQLGLTTLLPDPHFPPRQPTEVDDADVRALLSIATMVDTVEDDTMNTAMRSSDWKSRRKGSNETGSEQSWSSMLGLSSSPTSSGHASSSMAVPARMRSPSGSRLATSPTTHHMNTTSIGGSPTGGHSPSTMMALGSLSSLASSPPSSHAYSSPMQQNHSSTGFKQPSSSASVVSMNEAGGLHRNGSSSSQHTPISFGPATSSIPSRPHSTPTTHAPTVRPVLTTKGLPVHQQSAPPPKHPSLPTVSSPPRASSVPVATHHPTTSSAAAMASLGMTNPNSQGFPFSMTMPPLFASNPAANTSRLDYTSLQYPQQAAAAAAAGYPMNLYMPLLAPNLLPPQLLMNYSGYAGASLPGSLGSPMPGGLHPGLGQGINPGLSPGPSLGGSPLSTTIHDPSLMAGLRSTVPMAEANLQGVGASGLLELAQRAQHLDSSHLHSLPMATNATHSPASLLPSQSSPYSLHPQPMVGIQPQQQQNPSLPRMAKSEYPRISLLNGPNGADLAMSASAVTQSLEGAQFPMFGSSRGDNSSSNT